MYGRDEPVDAVVPFTPRDVKSGLIWIGGLSLFRDVLQFAATLVLVRLLDPGIYGQFSLANSVIALFTVVSARGFLEHTVQVRDRGPVDYQPYWTFGAFIQFAVIIALNAVALVLSRLPDARSVVPALHAMSVFFILDLAGELRVKMLERELDWTRLRLLEGAGLLSGTTASVFLAWRGAGVYALLLPSVIATVPFFCDLFFAARWRPSWQLDWSQFRPAWRYGVARISSGLVVRGQHLLESGVMTAVVGLAALGIYGRAVGLATFACLKLASLLTLTLFPMLTRLARRSPQFRRAGALVLRAVAWISIPAAAILAAIAIPLVHALYGKQWMPVAPLLPWTLGTSACAALTEGAAFLLLAGLDPKRTLAVDAVNLIGTALSLIFLLPRGIVPYMAGVLAFQFASLLLSLWWLLRGNTLEGNAIRSALLIPSLFAATIVIGTVLCRWAGASFASSIPSSAAVAALLTLCYLLTIRTFARADLSELLDFVPAGFAIRKLLRIDLA